MKALTVVGARPQFVKAAVVSRALRKHGIEEVLVHTGQHHDAGMSDIFFEELDLPAPAHHLGIFGGTHGRMTGRMMEALEAVLLSETPDWCLVYGDTNSTLAGALAAVKLYIPLAHVEAGLRSWNRRMPEEINRVLTDHASDLLFAPTMTALVNLEREGLADRAHKVGDVMYDATLRYGPAAAQRDFPARLGADPGKYVLATIHRAENADCHKRLKVIIEALEMVAETIPVLMPTHPRTNAALAAEGLLPGAKSRLRIVSPVGFLDMLALQGSAAVVVTDSGGVQKEAFFCQVPCVTLRDETEWLELIELGWNILAPPVASRSVAATILDRIGRRGSEGEPYGAGDASDRIARMLGSHAITRA